MEEREGETRRGEDEDAFPRDRRRKNELKPTVRLNFHFVSL